MDFPGVKQANICLGQWISNFSHVLRECHVCDFDYFSCIGLLPVKIQVILDGPWLANL